jgi:uncharacterized membrane protein HdeD (DUF308 family)
MKQQYIVKKNEKSKGQHTWLLLLIVGSLFTAIGVISMIYPWDIYIGLAIYSGFGIFANGILLLIFAFAVNSLKDEQYLVILESTLDILFGSVLIFNPFLAITALPIIIGIWICSRGIVKMILAFHLRKQLGGWMYIFSISFFSIAMGLIYLYYAWRFRKMENTLIAML